MDPLPEAILQLVMGHRAANPISRGELVSAVQSRGLLDGLSRSYADRKVRAAIQDLRTDHPVGARIVSSSSGTGYWLARTPEEIEDALAEDESRIRALSRRAKNMRRAADRLRAEPLRQKEMAL